jgi:hypothetical protein
MRSWIVSCSVAIVLAACGSNNESGNGSGAGGASGGVAAIANTGGALTVGGSSGSSEAPSSGGTSLGGTSSGGIGPELGGSSATGGSAGVLSCDGPAKLCGGACVLPAAANGCGDPGCTPCAMAPADGFIECVKGACDFGCFSGFVKNQSQCTLPVKDAGHD